MAYVDYNYYTNTYRGDTISQTDFPRYEERAEELIDAVTRYRVAEMGLTAFPARVQALIQKAVCAQINYYVEYGLAVALTGQDGGGFTVGKVTVLQHYGGSGGTGAATMLCPQALTLLEQTGLLDPAVPVFDGWWP